MEGCGIARADRGDGTLAHDQRHRISTAERGCVWSSGVVRLHTRSGCADLLLELDNAFGVPDSFRYTRFFLAVVDPDAEAFVDGDELIDLAWVAPAEALRREMENEWGIAFPTRKTLQLLDSEPSVDALVRRLGKMGAVPPIEPRLHVGDEEAQILMPDEEGFDEAGPSQSDPTILQRLSAVVAEGGSVPAEFRSRS